jgi:tRNA-2-methylthio-N6-dimethylallyladenosine synthase
VPGISITTDVIVGFCGETHAQFEATLALLRTVRFDQVFAAAFSVRPGTPAARLPDDVPAAEKRDRLNELLTLQEAIGLERNRAWVGRVTEVLVDTIRPEQVHDHEDPGGAGPDGELDATSGDTGRLSGRNRENKLVHLTGAPGLLGRRIPVLVERAGPYALVGRLAG